MRKIDPEAVAEMVREAYEEGWNDRAGEGRRGENADQMFELDWGNSYARIEHDKLTNLSEGI